MFSQLYSAMSAKIADRAKQEDYLAVLWSLAQKYAENIVVHSQRGLGVRTVIASMCRHSDSGVVLTKACRVIAKVVTASKDLAVVLSNDEAFTRALETAVQTYGNHYDDGVYLKNEAATIQKEMVRSNLCFCLLDVIVVE